MESHQFKGYLLRAARSTDLRLAQLWTARDPDHAGRVDPGFWLSQGARSQAYILIDSDGPVFFFKGIIRDETLEVHVQFPPYDDPAMRHRLRHRISQGLMDGMEWLENRVRGNIRSIIFESKTPALICFCVRRLGFTRENGRLRKQLVSAAESGLPSTQIANIGD